MGAKLTANVKITNSGETLSFDYPRERDLLFNYIKTYTFPNGIEALILSGFDEKERKENEEQELYSLFGKEHRPFLIESITLKTSELVVCEPLVSRLLSSIKGYFLTFLVIQDVPGKNMETARLELKTLTQRINQKRLESITNFVYPTTPKTKVVHISGPSGSGKSTIGERLSKGGKMTCDTDEYIQHHTPSGKMLLKMEKGAAPEEYRAAWTQILQFELAETLKIANYLKTPLLLLVGLLDNFALDCKDHPFELTFPVTKIYYEVPLPELLRRYYTRLASLDKDYWENVSEKRHRICSSENYIDDVAGLKEWHKQHGYVEMSIDQILKEFE